MKKQILAFSLLLLATLSVSAQKIKMQSDASQKVLVQDDPIYLDSSQPIEARIQDALSRMTLAEKVAMTHAQSKFSSSGVPRLGIPALWMSDGPHGVREEIQWNSRANAGWTNDSCVAFPALTCLAATWNTDLAGKYGKAIGEEARYRDKAILLGPGININRTPLNGRNFEYLGEDPYLAAELCVPYIQGVQKNGVACCVKHYALNNQETWRDNVDVELSDRALYEIYLPAFKAAVTRGGAWSIMGSYNKYRGQHCCHNKRLLVDVLKGEWNFDGCVVTDWGGAHSTDEAVNNGLDIEMGTYTNGLTTESKFTYEDYYLGRAYREGLQSGKYSTATIDDKASRILRLIFRTAMNSKRPYGSFATDDHFAVAREIGREGIVLLKNESKKGEKLLPIDASKYNKILVVGENATHRLTLGGGSSELKTKKEVSPLAALQEVYGNKITYAEGYKYGASLWDKDEIFPAEQMATLRKEAVEAAKSADLVVFVGGLNKNFRQDTEGSDRQSYGLPYGQDELIRELQSVCPRTIVVIISGNPVEMPWVKQIPAIVQSWYLGSENGSALADVLSGAVNPSGKLPFSYPKKMEDNGAISFGKESFPGVNQKQTYKEDILVGYRWYETKQIPVLFPFGYGQSYTTFKYGKPIVNNLTISIPITNTGTVAGREIVQLYVGAPKSEVLRPVKELKAFAKLPLLAPGETATATLTLTPESFQYFEESSHQWRTVPGTYKLYIGASSDDIREVTNIKR